MRKIARREDLLEQLEETVFALMMEEVAKIEGRKALEESEQLKNDESFAVPETTYRKGLDTIRRHFSKNSRRTAMRTMSKLISRVAVIILILLLLFTTAFATIPEFRAKTINLITEVFDDRTRIEFVDIEQRASASENDSLVEWVPEGFELIDNGESNIAVWEKYGNLEGFHVEVNVYCGDDVTYEVDTEHAIVEKMEVKGYSAMIVSKEDIIQVVIPVIKDERIYYVQGRGLDRDTVLRIVEGINIE